MTTNGERTYQNFIYKLIERADSYPSINIRLVEHIGNFFWPLMSQEYKDSIVSEHGNKFWAFSLELRRYFQNSCIDELFALWYDFNYLAHEKFDTFYEKCLVGLVCDVL